MWARLRPKARRPYNYPPVDPLRPGKCSPARRRGRRRPPPTHHAALMASIAAKSLHDIPILVPGGGQQMQRGRQHWGNTICAGAPTMEAAALATSRRPGGDGGGKEGTRFRLRDYKRRQICENHSKKSAMGVRAYTMSASATGGMDRKDDRKLPHKEHPSGRKGWMRKRATSLHI